jgi:hypothetical protein
VKSNKEKTRELAKLAQKWVQQVVMTLNEPQIKDNKPTLINLKEELSELIKCVNS